jgi:hypothetical protein
MKTGILLLLVILMLRIVAIFVHGRRASSPAAAEARAAEAQGPALRDMFLGMSAADAGATPPNTKYGGWAAAMDLSFDNGSATIVSTINGAASLYTSTGGGMIGGEAHEQVRAAAAGFVQATESCAVHMTAGPIQPLPSPGHVRFYAHARSDLLHSAEVPEQELASGKHPLSPCFRAGHNVVTQLRQLGPDA